MSDSASKPRPQFRNLSILQLMSYRLPLAGKTSILHRISGALLFVAGIVAATLVLVLLAAVATLLGSAIHAVVGVVLNVVLLLLFGTVMLVMLAGGAYFAWRDTFGDEAAPPVDAKFTGLEV